jgi:hypothetical protein
MAGRIVLAGRAAGFERRRDCRGKRGKPMTVWTAANCRGTAGHLSAAQRSRVDATWCHNWSASSGGDPAWVDAAKLDGTQAWMTDDALVRMAKANRSGYFLLGNEPELTNISLGEQCVLVHHASEVILKANPALKLLGMGWLAWCPQTGDGSQRPRQFRDRYQGMYGRVPPFAGIHFHAYKFPNRSLKEDAQRFMAAARLAFPKCELWVTECGSLVSTSMAKSAMSEFTTALAGVNRFAWFLGPYERQWESVCLFKQDGSLTALGRQYKNKGSRLLAIISRLYDGGGIR